MRYGSLLAVAGLLATLTARADRVLLSPEGQTLGPKGFKTEFAISPFQDERNLAWLQISTAQGIELEAARWERFGDNKTRVAFNLQYPLLFDLGQFPAISVGVRDLFNAGSEPYSVYVAVSKSIPLSDAQYRLIRDLRLNAGLGTGRIGGPFIGVQARFAAGFQFYGEVYRRRPNAGIALPLLRDMQARAYSLDGDLYFGFSYRLVR